MYVMYNEWVWHAHGWAWHARMRKRDREKGEKGRRGREGEGKVTLKFSTNVTGLCRRQCRHLDVTYVIKWAWLPTTVVSLARKV